MIDESLFVDVAVPVLSIAVPGVILWIVKLQDKIGSIELDLAKRYHDKAELSEIIKEAVQPLKDAFSELRNEIKQLRSMQWPNSKS